jgi:hypothetical protein
MIKWASDVGAPVAVVAADLITESYAPTWNEWISYIMAGGGYAAAAFNFWGPLVKNIAIASLPWAAKNLYSRFGGGMTRRASRASMTFKAHKVARYPAPAMENPFGGVRLV